MLLYMLQSIGIALPVVRNTPRVIAEPVTMFRGHTRSSEARKSWKYWNLLVWDLLSPSIVEYAQVRICTNEHRPEQKILFFEATTRRTTRQSMGMAQEYPCRPYGAGRTVRGSPEGPRTRKNQFSWFWMAFFLEAWLLYIYLVNP